MFFACSRLKTTLSKSDKKFIEYDIIIYGESLVGSSLLSAAVAAILSTLTTEYLD